MRCVDRPSILYSGGKVYLILFWRITIKINWCCVISLAQYILVRNLHGGQNLFCVCYKLVLLKIHVTVKPKSLCVHHKMVLLVYCENFRISLRYHFYHSHKQLLVLYIVSTLF